MAGKKEIIKLIDNPLEKDWDKIVRRPVNDLSSLEKPVLKILERVKKKGDKAVSKFTKEFDGVELKKLEVTKDEIEAAANLLSPRLRSAIQQAKKNIERFHRSQIESETIVETMTGVKCWRRSLPIENIGLYIPGGTAPLFSTVLMLAVPAMIAGCRRVILCTPPLKDGSVHPAVLYSAALCNVHSIFRIGGVQAIGAITYGTETVGKVDKIFGPGNQFVTVAKQLVQKEIAIDMPAGPSEVLVIADDTADPSFVAADLLSQAEHGTDSQVMLITTSKTIAENVIAELKKQLDELPRKKIIKQTLKNSRIILLSSPDEAIELSNLYAPEHLILSCINAKELSERVTSAGSVFIGNYSPESAGDYASGTNHTLPTNGYARMYSGVSLDSFVKKVTFQELSEDGLRSLAPTITEMALAEGLEAHNKAITIRLKEKNGI